MSVFRRKVRPVVLVEKQVTKRGLVKPGFEGDADVLKLHLMMGHDHRLIHELRMSDRAWLAPWEATLPPQSTEKLPTLEQFIVTSDQAAQEGSTHSWMLVVDDEVVGQVTVSHIQRGAMQNATVGYWISSRWAGRGITPLAVAMVVDYCLRDYGLHRIEINIRPQNSASLALANKLGLREEGLRRAYMCINNKWEDHRSFAVTAEELPSSGLVGRLENQNAAES